MKTSEILKFEDSSKTKTYIPLNIIFWQINKTIIY